MAGDKQSNSGWLVDKWVFDPHGQRFAICVEAKTRKGLKVKFGGSRCTISTSAKRVVAVAELRSNQLLVYAEGSGGYKGGYWTLV